LSQSPPARKNDFSSACQPEVVDPTVPDVGSVRDHPERRELIDEIRHVAAMDPEYVGDLLKGLRR